MPKAEVTLPAAVSSVPTARHFVESVLATWDLRELGWDATLIVSELAANAALHASGGGTFTLCVDSEHQDGVRLELHDRSRALPRQRQHSADATTGRGLSLVETLASEWGVSPSADGKTVWVLLRRDRPEVRLEDDDLDVILGAFGEDDGIARPDARGPLALAA